MRKLLIAPLVLMLAYLAWPLTAAWQLRVAVKANDIAAIESKVDWATLRANLKQTIGSNLKEKSTDPQRGLVTRVLIGTLGPAAAGAVIDFTVTPLTLGKVLAGRSLLDDLGMTRQRDAGAASPAENPGDDPAADPLAPRRLRWAFFESPTRFKLEFDRPEDARQARGQHPRLAGRALEAGRRLLRDADLTSADARDKVGSSVSSKRPRERSAEGRAEASFPCSAKPASSPIHGRINAVPAVQKNSTGQPWAKPNHGKRQVPAESPLIRRPATCTRP